MANENKVDKTITRAQGFRMTLTVIASYLPLVPVFWFLVKPVLVSSVSVAIAEDVQNQVEQGIAPMNSAFKILLQMDIDEKKREIADMEYKKRNDNGDWTAKDATDLANCKITLDALVAARKELQNETG